MPFPEWMRAILLDYYEKGMRGVVHHLLITEAAQATGLTRSVNEPFVHLMMMLAILYDKHL